MRHFQNLQAVLSLKQLRRSELHRASAVRSSMIRSLTPGQLFDSATGDRPSQPSHSGDLWLTMPRRDGILPGEERTNQPCFNPHPDGGRMKHVSMRKSVPGRMPSCPIPNRPRRAALAAI